MKRRTARKIVKALLRGENRWRHDTAAKAERIADSEPCREFYRLIKNMLPSWANYTEGIVTQEPCTTVGAAAHRVLGHRAHRSHSTPQLLNRGRG